MYETDAPAASRQSEPFGAVPGHWYVDLQTEELPPAPTKSQRKQVNRASQRAAAAGKNKKPPQPGSGFDAVEGELNRNAASVCMAAL